jgi:hypothetical protein
LWGAIAIVGYVIISGFFEPDENARLRAALAKIGSPLREWWFGRLKFPYFKAFYVTYLKEVYLRVQEKQIN